MFTLFRDFFAYLLGAARDTSSYAASSLGFAKQISKFATCLFLSEKPNDFLHDTYRIMQVTQRFFMILMSFDIFNSAY